jgi:hypothetical protein
MFDRFNRFKLNTPSARIIKNKMKEIFKIEANTPLALALLNNNEAQIQLRDLVVKMRMEIIGGIANSLWGNADYKWFFDESTKNTKPITPPVQE